MAWCTAEAVWLVGVGSFVEVLVMCFEGFKIPAYAPIPPSDSFMLESGGERT